MTEKVAKRVKAVGRTVTAIERLRSNLLVKMLPSLINDHYARVLYGKPISWVIVTEDQEYLNKIARVERDPIDPKDYLKFYDLDNNRLESPPDDIVVMFNLSGEHVPGT